MSKSLLYRLFGAGRLPPARRQLLARERIELEDEGVRGSITLRDFRSGQRRASWRRSGFAGALACTSERFVAFVFSRQILDVPLSEPRIAEVHVVADRPALLRLEFDASLWRGDSKGRVELRYRTEKARRFAERITGAQARLPRREP